ncbi:hypothetical protein PGT21_036787 [Puccinia graminis f. sp. tritici]|uniref:Uncharacterized protein n=1 Tax=Puccinia graminis f. sp. tritici TaxID=56615 RepID=A0A5B0RKC7_PUCGR|nr:hypothetical protein PGT21_036787 [Puccinia graminis f. sp. tritici]KAA1126157.1 hypothetical protein PGTUg99_002292 [Puccinia graminis f. sp. tritici]
MEQTQTQDQQEYQAVHPLASAEEEEEVYISHTRMQSNPTNYSGPTVFQFGGGRQTTFQRAGFNCCQQQQQNPNEPEV